MLHQIGVGALGPVFRTYEPERDRLVAVKVFRLDITPETAAALADELSHAAEAGLFHPSIVEPIAAGIEGSVAYNAEEYVASESLDAAMRHYAPAPLESVLPLITQLAGAIDFARAAGIGHGALHPRDIFMTEDEVRATGFGVVESLERVGIRAPIRRPYSAPERIAGGDWSTEADVFSLAVVTYELLTGRRPAGLGSEIGPLTAGVPDARLEALHGVLARAMSEAPARRYSTALAFASALENAARGETPFDVEGETASAGAVTAAAVAPPSVPARGVADSDSIAAFETEDAASSGMEADDVAIERDEDEAHHQLAQHELDEADERDAEPSMDEDSAAEAEADRYAADDFLLGVAGAASAPRELGSLDDFPEREPAADRRARADDEVMIGEPPPSTLLEPADLVRDVEDPGLAPVYAAAAAGVESAGRSRYRSPDEYRPLGVTDNDVPLRRRWPVVLMFIVGLSAGIGAGYVLWGRGAGAPAAREFSEASVTPPAPAAPTGSAGTTPAGSTPSGASDRAASDSAAGPGSTAGTAPRSGGVRAAAPVTSAASPRAGAEASPRGAAPAATAKPPARTAPTGTLVVRSTPSGAGVTVNGRWRGRTPLTLDELPFARYDVRVVQQGYTTAQEAVQLSAAEPARSLAFRLQGQTRPASRAASGPASAPGAATDRPQSYTGSVYVDSRPRGAKVFIDGKPVGVTPLSVPEIGIGSHVVRLELPDHRIWSSATRVVAGQTARVTGSLERIQ